MFLALTRSARSMPSLIALRSVLIFIVGEGVEASIVVIRTPPSSGRQTACASDSGARSPGSYALGASPFLGGGGSCPILSRSIHCSMFQVARKPFSIALSSSMAISVWRCISLLSQTNSGSPSSVKMVGSYFSFVVTHRSSAV